MDENKSIISRAPLRISFAGGGTDINEVFEKYGGYVINTTIDKYVYVKVKYKKGKVTVNGEEPKDKLTKEILRRMKAKNMEISTWYEVPFGRGLGSSSAYSVAMINAISKFNGAILNTSEIIEYAYNLENSLGKCGWQDQIAVASGGFNWIEFNNRKVVIPLLITTNDISDLERQLCLVYTGKEHISSNVHSKKPIMTEITANTLKNIAREVRDCLMLSDIDKIGELLTLNWEIKKDSNNTDEDINNLYELGFKYGATGGKLLGAGLGGYILFFIPPENMFNFRKKIRDKGYEILDFKFTNKGVETWEK